MTARSEVARDTNVDMFSATSILSQHLKSIHFNFKAEDIKALLNKTVDHIQHTLTGARQSLHATNGPLTYLQQNPPTTHQYTIPSDTAVATALTKHCAFYPDAMGFLLNPQECREIGTLFFKENPSTEDLARLNTLTKQVMDNLIDKLNVDITAATNAGCDKTAIADIVNDALWAVGRKNGDGIEEALDLVHTNFNQLIATTTAQATPAEV